MSKGLNYYLPSFIYLKGQEGYTLIERLGLGEAAGLEGGRGPKDQPAALYSLVFRAAELSTLSSELARCSK